jgi:serine protease Do
LGKIGNDSSEFGVPTMNSPRLIGLVLAAWAAVTFASRAGAETLVLQDGQKLQAQVVKADDRSVIVDLGFDLLRIPRSSVRQIQQDPCDTGSPVHPDPAGAAPGASHQTGLYYTGQLEPTTIERSAERFAEAVVMVTSPAGQGSGFIVNEKGYLITNYHVIAGETLIKVTVFHRASSGFEQQVYKKVRIVAFNPFVDLALLKIEEAEQPFQYVMLGQIDQVAAGQTCFAIGNPLGLTRTVSQGIVSNTHRDYDGRLYIQTTTDINPGNSGGPLFNLRGEVIGVTSMGYLFLGGLNFAIPVDAVQRFIENWDAFAFNEDNPNAGFRYLQPVARKNLGGPPASRLPEG